MRNSKSSNNSSYLSLSVTPASWSGLRIRGPGTGRKCVLREPSAYSRAPSGYWAWGANTVLGSPDLGEPRGHPKAPAQTWTSLCPIPVLRALSMRRWGWVTLRVHPVKRSAEMPRANDKASSWLEMGEDGDLDQDRTS